MTSIPISSHGLTSSQMMLWTGQELNPGTPLYNMVLAFTIRGSLDPKIFRQAFHHLVDQCDALRLTFSEKQGKPSQQINRMVEYEFEYLDFSGRHDIESQAWNWIQENSQNLLDLSTCAFHSALIKLAPDQHIWYLNQHHLITDAWSVSVQYGAMAGIYDSLLSQQELPPPLPSYLNYVAFEKQARQDQANRESEQYWHHQLKKVPQTPRFYGHSNPVFGTRTTRVSLDLGKERTDRLRSRTEEEDLKAWTQHLSLYNIFATILSIYLYRVTAQEKVSFGTPAHNRTTVPLKNTPGLFIELYPIVTELESGQTFQSVFENLQLQIHDFLRNAKPGIASADLNRCFHVILNYIHAQFSDFNGLKTQTSWVHANHCDPRHYLRVQVHDFDESGSIEINFDLHHEVFSPEQFSRVADHFLTLLDAFIEDRNQPIDQPQLLSSADQKALIRKFNETDRTEPIDIVRQFSNILAKNRESVAIQHHHRSISFEQLDSESNKLATYLRTMGIGRGHNVVINLKRSIDYFISVWGILKCGAAFVPVAINTPEYRLKYIIEDVEASLVISENSSVLSGLREIKDLDPAPTNYQVQPQDHAYIIYTSGSTGKPKGVVIRHGALANYLAAAKHLYLDQHQFTETPIFPFFTNISFDLTITSVFLPTLAGGSVIVYEEPKSGPDLTLLNVVKDNHVNAIKLTPAHLALLKGQDLSQSRIKLMVAGGEKLLSQEVREVLQLFGKEPVLFNEYGPTEATVGCIAHKFQIDSDRESLVVAIGKPIANMRAYVLNSCLNPQPIGTSGDLYLAGKGLTSGYWKMTEHSSFVDDPFHPGEKMYKTGDLAFMNNSQQLVFTGRKDHQVQIGGARVELGEIEAQIASHPRIQRCVVDLELLRNQVKDLPDDNCKKCGIPSIYPGIKFNASGICDLCLSFEEYKQKVSTYFKRKDELRTLLSSKRLSEDRAYHCIMLLSGGKDSTYALSQLVEMDLQVLAFTLDNGYISDQAKSNIQKVVKALGVDHVFGETKAMNEIFADSLERFSNVCNGCFKTIYTLSTNLAVKKNIPFIVTGLSRGQFFETRLTEELFRSQNIDSEDIDRTILEARRIYHRTDDAVSRLLDVSVFQDDKIFEKVQFVDYYRYCDASLDEMLEYLHQKLPWIRPTDTGRSTNCLINQAGIYIHKKEKGYSNYAFPYSWDVRIGHKSREASLDEINEKIDERQVHKILNEIGYHPERSTPQQKQLVAYYQVGIDVEKYDLVSYLSKFLPDYMIPVRFVPVKEIPLTSNGKVDREALKKISAEQRSTDKNLVASKTLIEKKIHRIWSEVLKTNDFGIQQDFLQLGGNSLAAIRVMARINESLKLDLSLASIFEFPTIEAFSKYVEDTIRLLLNQE